MALVRKLIGNIKGLKGDPGEQGLQGPKGDKGDPGINATTTDIATETSNGLMSSADKTKLNKYPDTTTSISKHLREDGTWEDLSIKYADKKKYGDTEVSVGRKVNTTVGRISFAFGSNVEASGDQSHAEGYFTIASGRYSHAEGFRATASGQSSHAEGGTTTASGNNSHAEGFYTTALNYQHAQGHHNDITIATENSASGTSTGTAFVIGNGTTDAKSNAFRVTGEGVTYAKGAYNTTGADYAEFAEWADGNPDNEDRRGYFVTFDETKTIMIRKANAGDYILGIVSGNPCIIGNADESWLGKYVFDEFGAIVYEEVEIEREYLDPETEETITKKETITTYKLNPDYDKTQKYIHRQYRKEWDAVGWIGVLSVRDDGTCIPGSYCIPADGGIATASERVDGAYRVLERISDNVIKVALK